MPLLPLSHSRRRRPIVTKRCSIRPSDIVVGGLRFYCDCIPTSYPPSLLNGTQPRPATCSVQTLITHGFSSDRVLASCIHAAAWCCCCHGNYAVSTQPISSFSNAVNSQLNADASSEKLIHNGPILMKLYQPALGVRFFETQCMSDITKQCTQVAEMNQPSHVWKR